MVCVGFGPGPAEVPLPAGAEARIAVATGEGCSVEATHDGGAAVRLAGLAAVVLALPPSV
jgi:maltooligosyltrehalose trehalohydrolase